MTSRLPAALALAVLAGCGGVAAEGEADPLFSASASPEAGETCTYDDQCGCYERCTTDPYTGPTCTPAGTPRPDHTQCPGSVDANCFLGVCCNVNLDACPDDGKACTHASCSADTNSCGPQVLYCPPRSACDSGSGVCGAGDLCDYSAVYAGEGASCGASLWCFAGLCRPGCYIAGSYYDPGATRPFNPCQSCQPAVSRIDWSDLPDGSSCGSGRVCAGAGCSDGCLIGGQLRSIGERNPANECQSCEAASGTGWTNTTSSCADDGDPCTTDRCGGDGVCHHAAGACDARQADSMFGCSSAGGGGGMALLLVAAGLGLRRRRRGASLLAALLLLAPAVAAAGAPGTAPADRPRVAIFTFRAGPEVSGKTAEFVTQSFGAALHDRGISTLSQEDVKAALGFERQRQMLGCATDACFAEIGGALGVRQIVTGGLGRLGESLVVNAQLIDARSAAVERRHEVRVAASRGDAAFLEAIPELVDALFPPEGGAERPRPLAVELGGWGELDRDAGGAILLAARWRLSQSLRASAGLLATPRRVGGALSLGWIPWNASGRVYPLVAVQALALAADPISPGVGLSVGAEWRVLPRLDLSLQIPVFRFTAVEPGMRETYAFAALSAAWRI